MNWTELLDPLNGGPGEPPGRVELVQQLQEEKALRGDSDSVQQPKGCKRKRKKQRG